MALQDDVRNLASVPAFRDLENDALRLIAFSGETRILRAGDVLFKRGETSDGGYVLMSGTIVLETSYDHKTTIQAPALIGATALVSETIRPATAFAREPSNILKITRNLFHRVLSEYPVSAARLRSSMASDMASLRQNMANVQHSLIQDL